MVWGGSTHRTNRQVFLLIYCTNGKSVMRKKLEVTQEVRDAIYRKVRKRDRHACQKCGQQTSNRNLTVHHIDYDKQNCNLDNLKTLCRNCNNQVNFGREYWKQYFQNY